MLTGPTCFFLQQDSLSDLMKFDHGYTASSPPIRNVSHTNVLSESWPCVFYYILWWNCCAYGRSFDNKYVHAAVGYHEWVHTRGATSIFALCYWSPTASTWRTCSTKPKTYNCSKGSNSQPRLHFPLQGLGEEVFSCPSMNLLFKGSLFATLSKLSCNGCPEECIDWPFVDWCMHFCGSMSTAPNGRQRDSPRYNTTRNCGRIGHHTSRQGSAKCHDLCQLSEASALFLQGAYVKISFLGSDMNILKSYYEMCFLTLFNDPFHLHHEWYIVLDTVGTAGWLNCCNDAGGFEGKVVICDLWRSRVLRPLLGILVTGAQWDILFRWQKWWKTQQFGRSCC